ncbi:MAG: hypothetical protein ACAH83_13140 [Alphaproteobacteria bacterium]
MYENLGKDLMKVFAGVVLVGTVGAGAIFYGIGHHEGNVHNSATYGVRLSDEQKTLRKNGAVCDNYLVEAFKQSLKEGKTIDLKLPANPTQNCPPAPGQ